jgi:nucleoid-associated protein YgaU
MPRKKVVTSSQKESASKQESPSGIFDYFRFGESYTSLILGMVVVILAVVLVAALVRNKSFSGVITHQSQPKQEVSSTSIGPQKPVEQQANTTTPKPIPVKSGSVYTVQAGDTLWAIAEKTYKSGYNWVDIAQANNLANPGAIDTGMNLKLPQVAPKLATVTNTPQTTLSVPNAITTTSYTVQHGDSLWSIAIRAYGDGYKWSQIAKVNNIRSPDIIFSGTTLKLPRT